MFDEDDISHALIELASDNELRIRLGGGHYFEVDEIPIGHPHLLEIEREKYRDWLLYLTNNQTIFDFLDVQQKKSTTLPNKGSIVL